jgi:hypothetical protein
MILYSVREIYCHEMRSCDVNVEKSYTRIIRDYSTFFWYLLLQLLKHHFRVGMCLNLLCVLILLPKTQGH